jgi:glycosyltransferase involved in cell wall biosynthesis
MANKLVDEIYSRGAKLIYCFDDNFLDPEIIKKGIDPAKVDSFRTFLLRSHGQIVTTPTLRDIYAQYQPKVIVIPNSLDEQLIVRRSYVSKDKQQKIVIGYMGTATHDDDLAMVIPALRRINELHPNRLRVQIIGALDDQDQSKWEDLKKIPLDIIHPKDGESEYPLFMLWFTGTIRWDIAIAPLVDNQFNRCKSDIKYLDYTAACVPGLYSSLLAYDTVLNGDTGLVLHEDEQEWVDALNNMINNPKLRADILNNAREYLYDERILGVVYKDWIKALEGFG